jgi:drug/metabolite transporter (DMT)-like permease
MNNKTLLGHFLAIITILIWGTTFVATKTLLTEFSPEEILAYRFFGAFIILIFIYPKNIKFSSFGEEFLFFLLGLSGVTIYYWSENLALKYTYASNVGLIVSAIPIFTALVAHFMTKDERFTINLFLGFITAMLGIAMVIFNGKTLKINSMGDLFAMISALSFSFYSVLIKKVNKRYSQFFVVRKTFFYGILTMLPILIISGISMPKPSQLSVSVILNLLFLTIFASLLCFIMWNKAINILGSVKTTNYVYLVPFIALISSVLILHEKVTILMLLGGVLIFLGIFINENKWLSKALRFNYSDSIYSKENSD